MFSQSDCVELKECLACGSKNLELTLNLNAQPLANSYKNGKNDVEQIFPLAINHCIDCLHIQLTHAVNPDLMYKDYLYVSGTSQTMKDHFEWFARYSKEYYETLSKEFLDSVLDIGCNDGSQLNYFISDTIETYGVDPAENLAVTSRAKGHDIHVGYFDESFVKVAGMYDIIIAQNVFAHNYDPLTFLNNAKDVMARNSLLFIQTSQADMIVNNEFDTIYHEHISFYNINSMNALCKRASLNLIDIVKCPLHGNSYIFIISKYVSRSANIENLIEMERKAGLLSEETYEMYALKCQMVGVSFKAAIDRTYEMYALKCQMVGVSFKAAIDRARTDGYKIVGYGAAAKGMTLLNYTKAKLDYIIDDNPLKQGKYTPGYSVEIISFDDLPYGENEKIMFIPLAWNFFKEISSKIRSKRDNENDLFLKYFPIVVVI